MPSASVPYVPASWPQDVRGRMMARMAQAATERGYAATRVRDVLDGSGISRRTFYVYFGNRDDCFFATYDAIVADLHRLITPPAGNDAQAMLEPILSQVLAHFSRWPSHAQLFLTEILSAGPNGAARHEQSMTMLASRFVACPHWQPGDCEALDRAQAAHALVGAMVRIVQRDLLGGGGDTLPSLTPSLLALGTRVAAA